MILRIGRQYFTISDEVGNLDGNARTNDVPAWEFPEGMTEDGSRTSLIVSLMKVFHASVQTWRTTLSNRSVAQMTLALPEKEVLIPSIVGFMPLILSSLTSYPPYLVWK